MDETSRSVIVPKNLPAQSATFNCDNSSIAIGENSTINHIQSNVFLAPMPAARQQQFMPDQPLNVTCYNLIITEDDFNCVSGTIKMPTHQVFLDSITPQLDQEFHSLDDAAQEKLCSFPCILANPNRHGHWTDDDQIAYYGRITGIQHHGHFIWLDYYLYSPIQQQQLNCIVSELDIQHTDLSNEFDTPHWTVKATDLPDILCLHNIRIPLLATCH